MGKNKLLYFLSLSLLAGFVLWICWVPKNTTFLVFIAFVPLLMLEDLINEYRVRRSALSVFLYSYLAFFTWNLLTTYWVYNASLSGAVMAVLLNALLMTVPFLLFHKVRVILKRSSAYFFLITFWMTYEYLHLNWDLAWPWLNLGNVFAMTPGWIQWYEYTGTFGGTIWVWSVNILVYFAIKRYLIIKKESASPVKLIPILVLIILTFGVPIIISRSIKIDESKPINKNVVIVQPNIDPYTMKFTTPLEIQIHKLLILTEKAVDSNTVLVVWPETAISRNTDEAFINRDPVIRWIRDFLNKHPNVKLISGIDSYRFFEEGEEPSSTARQLRSGELYDSYNAAILMDTSPEYSIYHKSRLVPGVEKMPYPTIFKFLENLVIDLGGTSGSLGKQPEASVFKVDEEIIAAPLICYESIFGDYSGDFVLKGANIFTIITNDGWWGFTDGHKQHYIYAVLRAIEFRKDIIRSANTGISCYINSKGEIFDKTDYWVDAVFKHEIALNDKITFYAMSGDYLARISLFMSIMIILVAISKGILGKKVHGDQILFDKNM